MPPNLIGKRVVIIEDEGLTLLGLQRICESYRMIVVGTAHNGREGVDMVLLQQPDIVLADINMPEMDGLEASRQILRQIHVCILLVTAYVDTTDLDEIAQIGVHGYLGKPVTKDILLPAIKEAYEHFLQAKAFGQ